jgi:integrase
MPLKLFLRNETWHYRGTVAHRRLRGSTGVSRANKETAEQVLVQIEERVWRGRLYGPGSVLTFAQAAILYRAARKPLRYLAIVEDYWKDTPIKELTAGKIRASCMELYPSAKGATWNRAVIVPTQAIINHAAEQELCPRITVKRWPVEKTERRPVSWEWVTTFLSAASPHLGALAIFMFLTGARVSEACALRWIDVDFTQLSALIRQTKTNTMRLAHLPSEALIALANIPGDRGPDAKVFGFRNRFQAEREWKKVVDREGLEPLTPHCCRHGFATGMLQAGVDPVTTAKLGGWKSPEHVFKTYGHASEDRTLTNRLTGGYGEKNGDRSASRRNQKRAR